MKISARGRYGLRLLIDLAQHVGKNPITLGSAAERLGISVRYLEQVAIILRKAGFIRSVKGAQGGYALRMRPGDIVIGNALRELEGDMLVIDPPVSDAGENSLQRCVREQVFDKINESIASVIDKETLAGLTGINETYSNLEYFI
jgi:Rrf2 family protein